MNAAGKVTQGQALEEEGGSCSQGEQFVPETAREGVPDKPLSEYTSHEIGQEGEHLAASYLEKRGYEVLERNWRCSSGEVDIIAREGDTVVLVEVKTRLTLGESSDVMPELAVDRRKQRRYRKLALLYLACHPDVTSVRFDVIALNIVGERCARLRHLIGAYSWDE